MRSRGYEQMRHAGGRRSIEGREGRGDKGQSTTPTSTFSGFFYSQFEGEGGRKGRGRRRKKHGRDKY